MPDFKFDVEAMRKNIDRVFKENEVGSQIKKIFNTKLTPPTTEEKAAVLCAMDVHIEPYYKGDPRPNYYCSRCKKGMGNAYFQYRQKAEKDLAAARTRITELESQLAIFSTLSWG